MYIRYALHAYCMQGTWTTCQLPLVEGLSAKAFDRADCRYVPTLLQRTGTLTGADLAVLPSRGTVLSASMSSETSPGSEFVLEPDRSWLSEAVLAVRVNGDCAASWKDDVGGRGGLSAVKLPLWVGLCRGLPALSICLALKQGAKGVCCQEPMHLDPG